MPLPVLSVKQMQRWEMSSWRAGKIREEVIDNVGRALAQRLENLAPPGAVILFLAGKGNNGQDAVAAHRHLDAEREGILVNVVDPAKNLAQLKRSQFHQADWIVDGLFGVGLNRPLSPLWQKFIAAVNSSGIPVVAVDVPSGLNADTGKAENAAIRAEITLTVGAPKKGLLLNPGAVGRLEVLSNVGLEPCLIDSKLQWTQAADFKGWPCRRPVDGNKGTFGHLAFIAGSRGYHGAAVLGGQGATRAQTGLVTIFPQESVYVPVAAQFHSVMVSPWRAAQPLPKSCTAIGFGPGLAQPDLPESFREELKSYWLNSPWPVLADASALDWLPSGATPRRAIRVMTPHPGEAGRLLGCSAADVQSDRVSALRKLSRRFGDCFVVLKGNQTLVGQARGKIYVNSTGNPHMAQGGSGDLLSGYLSGLLAQKAWQADPLQTIRYAVWQHGAAADYLTTHCANWTVEDLSRVLGSISPDDS